MKRVIGMSIVVLLFAALSAPTAEAIVVGEVGVGEVPRVEAWFSFPQTSWVGVHQSTGYEFQY